MHAIEVRTTGGPEVLQLTERPGRAPGPGEVRVQVRAAGVNFIDIYHRSGAYKVELPFVPGSEGAGVVAEVGAGVADWAPGARVAWALGAGSYASEVTLPAAQLVEVPPAIGLEQAAALMLQGMTAHYLACSTFPLAAGHRCLVHAAAGGVGRLLCQLAKQRGARVYGTVSTPEKVEAALASGADEVVVYGDGRFAEEIERRTSGEKLDVVYDSVGRTSFEQSLSCLKPRGTMVLYGQSSGAVPPFDPQILSKLGSLFLTRPTLGHYVATREELAWRAGELFRWVGSGRLSVHIERALPLAEAAQAHTLLASRKTSGKLLLTP